MEGQRLGSQSWCGGLQEQEPWVQLGQTGMHGVGGRWGLNQQVVQTPAPFIYFQTCSKVTRIVKGTPAHPLPRFARPLPTLPYLLDHPVSPPPSHPLIHTHTRVHACTHTHPKLLELYLEMAPFFTPKYFSVHFQRTRTLSSTNTAQ